MTGKLEKITKPTSMHSMDCGTRTLDENVVRTQILVEVVYGLSSRNCKGMGICKINAVDSPDYQAGKTLCGASLAYLQVLNSTTIRFEFLKDSITPEQYSLRFASGYFCLEETFSFSDQLATALGIDNNSLAKGVYRIKTGPEFIAVDFLQD